MAISCEGRRFVSRKFLSLLRVPLRRLEHLSLFAETTLPGCLEEVKRSVMVEPCLE